MWEDWENDEEWQELKREMEEWTEPDEQGFYKTNKNNKMWFKDVDKQKGTHLFSFDRKKIYNFFADYPHNLTAEELRISIEEGGILGDMRIKEAKERLKELEIEEQQKKHT